MTEPLYRLRIANGNEYGPSSASDICHSIRAGRIAINSWVAVKPFTHFVVITEVEAFDSAFHELSSAQAPKATPSKPQERPQTAADFLFESGAETDRAKSFHPLANTSTEIEISQVEALAAERAKAADGQTEDTDEISRYLNERAQFDEAVRDLEEGRYTDAKSKFEILARDHPKTSEYHSSLAYADFKLAATEQQAVAIIGRLREIHEQSPYCVPTLLFVGRANNKCGRPKAAVRYLKAALEIEPNRRDIQLELQESEDLASGKKVRATSSGSHRVSSEINSGSTSRSGSHFRVTSSIKGKSKRASKFQMESQIPRLLGSLAACGILFGIFYFTAVLSQMGTNEYFYLPSDRFFLMRRFILILTGIALSFFFLKDEGFAKDDFLCDPVWIVVAIAFGGAVGFYSPPQAVKSTLAVVIGLTIFHVIAEEIFFRGFLARNLALSLPGNVAPSVVGGLLFGLYHMTYYSFAADPLKVVDFSTIKPTFEGALFETDPEVYRQLTLGLTTNLEAWTSVGMIAFAAGIPLFYLYYKSRSFTPPLLCHLAINLSMMILSYDALKL